MTFTHVANMASQTRAVPSALPDTMRPPRGRFLGEARDHVDASHGVGVAREAPHAPPRVQVPQLHGRVLAAAHHVLEVAAQRQAQHRPGVAREGVEERGRVLAAAELLHKAAVAREPLNAARAEVGGGGQRVFQLGCKVIGKNARKVPLLL